MGGLGGGSGAQGGTSARSLARWLLTWAVLGFVGFSLGAGWGGALTSRDDGEASATTERDARLAVARVAPLKPANVDVDVDVDVDPDVRPPPRQARPSDPLQTTKTTTTTTTTMTGDACSLSPAEADAAVPVPNLERDGSTRVEPDVRSIRAKWCPETSSPSTDLASERKGFSVLLDFLLTKKACTAPLNETEFVCAARCAAHEPELERTVRIMRMAEHGPDYVVDACRRHVFPFLVWISKGGRIRFFNCLETYSSDGFMGKEVWKEDMRMLFTLGCVVRLPEDVIFGFDWSDYATPGFTGAPHDLYKYMVPLPPILRPVGTDAYPSLLFPTGSFIVATGFCNFRYPNKWWRLCIAHQDRRDGVKWSARKPELMWRGAPNGLQWTVNDWRMMQRARLVREFGHEPGFDVAFVQGIHARSENDQLSYSEADGVKHITARNQLFPRGTPLVLNPDDVVREMEREWVRKDQIVKDRTTEFRHLLHVDGQTASWGLAHKFNSGGVLLWIESSRNYLEFYYPLMKPWEHFIPVAKDMSDLRAVKSWLDANQAEAERIARNAAKLADSRMRAQDTLCYVYRVLASVKAAQVKGTARADEAYMRSKFGDKIDSKFEDVRDYREWLPKARVAAGLPAERENGWVHPPPL